MDELEKRFFSSPDLYGKAIELLAKYQNVEHLPWIQVEELLSGLEDDEAALLEKAIEFKKIQNHELRRLSAEVEFLKQTVKSLATQPSITRGVPPAPPLIDPPLDREGDHLVTEIADKFLIYKKTYVAAGSFSSFESKIRQFVNIITEYNQKKTLKISELSPAIIRNYRDVMQKIPARRTGISKNVSIKDLIHRGLPPISQKTAKDTCNVIGDFLSYCERDGYPITPGLKSILSSVKKPKSKDTQHRIPYSKDHLKKMFESREYQQGLFKRPSDYWAPLIALFTGARLGEIVQMHLGDIREDNGIWVFDLNDDGDKKLKSDTSSRIVPIHSKLMDLGIIDFVKHLQNLKKSSKLFADEVRNPDAKFDAYSKRFQHFRKKVGAIPGDNEMLDFHSFRHTVRTKLADASIQESLIDDIVGHSSSGRSVGKKIYTHTQLIPQKKEAIETIIYDIDFTKIRPWDKSKLMILLR